MRPIALALGLSILLPIPAGAQECSGQLLLALEVHDRGFSTEIGAVRARDGQALPLLYSGPALEGASVHGLDVGPDGNIYTASTNLRRIDRFDRRTGRWLGTFSSDPELANPMGLAFGPDGNLYVAGHRSPHSGATRFEPRLLQIDGRTGRTLRVFGKEHLPEWSLAGVGLVFGPDGDLYVAHQVDEGTISRFAGPRSPDPLRFLGHLATNTGAYDLAFSPDGRRIYVTNFHGKSIDVLDARTGRRERVLVSGLDYPYLLDFGPDGRLYLMDEGHAQVYAHDPASGRRLATFASAEGGRSIKGMAFAPCGPGCRHGR